MEPPAQKGTPIWGIRNDVYNTGNGHDIRLEQSQKNWCLAVWSLGYLDSWLALCLLHCHLITVPVYLYCHFEHISVPAQRDQSPRLGTHRRSSSLYWLCHKNNNASGQWPRSRGVHLFMELGALTKWLAIDATARTEGIQYICNVTVSVRHTDKKRIYI